MTPTLARKINFQTLREIAAQNVGLLWDLKKWTQRQPRGRTIGRIRSGQGKPALDTMELIADKARIPVWYLLVPGMDEKAIATRDLEHLVNQYLSLDDEKRRKLFDYLELLSSARR